MYPRDVNKKTAKLFQNMDLVDISELIYGEQLGIYKRCRSRDSLIR